MAYISKINLGGQVYELKDSRLDSVDASIAAAISAAIAELKVDASGGDGYYIKSIAEEDGKIIATIGSTSEFDEAGAAAAVVGDASEGYQTLGEIQEKLGDSISAISGDEVISAEKSGSTVSLGMNISETEGNIIEVLEDGLYAYASQVEYTIERQSDPSTGEFIAVYRLLANGEAVGDPINIPKDLVIRKAGVIDYDGVAPKIIIDEEMIDVQGEHPAGKYIVMIIAVSEDQIWLDVKDLVDVYTAGDGINISADNVVSVALADSEEKIIDEHASTGKNFIEFDDASALIVKGVDADSAVTTEAITVAGGPVSITAANWPSAWKDGDGNCIIPQNVSIQDVLTNLFLKEVNGTISVAYSPTKANYKPTIKNPIATLAKTGTVEVGETTTFTAATVSGINSGASVKANLTANQGYFVGDSSVWNAAASGKTVQTVNCVADESALTISSITWNGTAAAAGSELTIKEGINTLEVKQSGTTISVAPFTEETYYASTNTKRKIAASVTITDQEYASPYTPVATATKPTVTGARACWYGFSDSAIDPDSLTNEYFRAITSAPSTTANVIGKSLTPLATGSSIQAQAGYLGLVITVPATKTITSIKKDGAPTDLISVMNVKTVSIEGANGFAALSYKVYYTSWAEGGDTSKWILTIE